MMSIPAATRAVTRSLSSGLVPTAAPTIYLQSSHGKLAVLAGRHTVINALRRPPAASEATFDWC